MICLIEMLSSSLYTMIKLSKTTSLNKLFDYDCVRLYIIYWIPTKKPLVHYCIIGCGVICELKLCVSWINKDAREVLKIECTRTKETMKDGQYSSSFFFPVQSHDYIFKIFLFKTVLLGSQNTKTERRK